MDNMVVNEETAAVEEKKAYELRALVATDMGSICKIISAIGVKRFKECFHVEDFEDKSKEEVGLGVLFDVADVIIVNIPRAEEEIQTFLAKLSGMKLSEIKNLPFADYGEMIMKVVMSEDFQDFFSRVMKLFKR